ncbi:MAG TPA: sialidase family protein, partial [Gemmatimonadaceae bacterium]|nr:sialidase family protein [Gemmatimonadaceae bacterium]
MSSQRALRVVVIFLLAAGSAFAATTPNAGTITPANPVLTFTGGPFAVSNPSNPAGQNPPVCTGATCGVYTLTVSVPSTDFNSYKARVTVGWTNSGTTTQQSDTSDFDVAIFSPDVTGTEVATAGTTANPEVAVFDVSGGSSYEIDVVPYDVSSTVTFNAKVELIRNTPSPWPGVAPNPTLPAGTPRFYNYHAPQGVAEDAGEPMIGVNRKSEKIFGGIPNGGTVNYFGGFLPYMLSVTFDDRTSPAATTWNQVPLVLANAPRAFGDPYLFTDKDTGRTFVAQELGLTPLGSTMEFTDNDNSPFTPSEGSGAPSGVDHETVGGGPFHAPVPTGASPVYPNGVWYCSQSIADAVCSISLDGGMTFGPAIPMYSVKDCSGLHGHIKIGPDGTAFVPNRACGGSAPNHNGDGAHPALVVSEDNGITWNVRPLPNATTMTDRDPSVGVGNDGTVYFAYQAGDGHSHVAVSKDKGLTWINDSDVGVQAGVKNALFHAAVAGDAGRAAVAYFGTETGGSNYATPDFPGVWSLYISTTFDGGLHWTTQNATPGDPIQRGGICGDGACRNLLDFFGAEIDKEGRVVVGYDDGCISANCISGFRSYGLIASNDFTAKAVIARQASGKRMYAAFDLQAGPDINPSGPPPPPPHAYTCDSIVVTDPAGDA